MSDQAARETLRSAFAAAVAAVRGDRAVACCLEGHGGELAIAGRPVDPRARIVVLAMGKAAVSMARAAESWAGDRLGGGLVVTRDPPTAGADLRLSLLEAGHPVPDERSEAAGRALLEAAQVVAPQDVLLVLLSGGASALTSCPVPGLDIADIAEGTRIMLACGATVDELNAFRKHTTLLGGGQLARASTAGRIELLAISDVPGDRLDVIGSGPCTPDGSRYGDVLAAMDRHGVRELLPERVLRHLEAGQAGTREETPGPEDPAFAKVRSRIVARSRDAVAAAASVLEAAGARVVCLEGALEGEASECGRDLVRRAAQALQPGSAAGQGEAVALVASGETIVHLRGEGRGGRNQELALAAAIELDALARTAGTPEITLLSAGTDGTDGPTDAAGAFADCRSLARGRAAGRDACSDLERNDSNGFFAAEGGLLTTGPTGTNVMDLALVWVEAKRDGPTPK